MLRAQRTAYHFTLRTVPLIHKMFNNIDILGLSMKHKHSYFIFLMYSIAIRLHLAKSFLTDEASFKTILRDYLRAKSLLENL